MQIQPLHHSEGEEINKIFCSVAEPPHQLVHISLHLFYYLFICSNAWFVMEECVLRVDRDIRSLQLVPLHL